MTSVTRRQEGEGRRREGTAEISESVWLQGQASLLLYNGDRPKCSIGSPRVGSLASRAVLAHRQQQRPPADTAQSTTATIVPSMRTPIRRLTHGRSALNDFGGRGRGTIVACRHARSSTPKISKRSMFRQAIGRRHVIFPTYHLAPGGAVSLQTEGLIKAGECSTTWLSCGNRTLARTGASRSFKVTR